jgi:lipopolysaccharide assembly outer membrane protein LptD (OstA)
MVIIWSIGNKANQVVTKGKAFVSYQDMRISADTIQANTKTDDIFAQGNVNFWKEYDQTRGDFMVYNMKTGKGWMREATIKRNRNFFKAQRCVCQPRLQSGNRCHADHMRK